jgi:hypothetical protein
LDEPGDVLALPMQAAARLSQPGAETDDLMAWVHQQRQADAT